jgi:DNA-binding PadR family transcriptional regulator
MPLQKSPLTVEHALLGLVRGQPMHGYEIYQQLNAPGGLGRVWRLKLGLLYAMLKRLEGEGLLIAVRSEQDEGPARRVLAVTPAGESAFARWVGTPVPAGRDLRVEFLAKLYFARRAGGDATAALVDAQVAVAAEWESRLEARRLALPAEAEYERLVLDYRLGQVRAAVAWLEVCKTLCAAAGA